MIEKKIRILLIEDEEFDVYRVEKTLSIVKDEIYLAKILSDGTDALKLIEQDPYQFDIVITDYQIAGGYSGAELIKKIKSLRKSLPIIVITKMTTNITDFDFANSLLIAGAYWYCTKYPMDVTEYIYQPTDFILSIKNAYSASLLEESANETNEKFNKTIEEKLKGQKIIGESEAVKKLLDQIEQYSITNANIIISGSSGTGKELVANNIHLKSERKFERFITINCGSLPSELIESELFGYEKGSFTGAIKEKKGLFEIANKGTVFLDEIAELPHSAQVKLLRFLESGEIDKIGRQTKITVDVRIISATNKDLKSEIKKKRFREDLFYRLNTINILTPSLSERTSDIPILLEYFLKIYETQMSRKAPTISPSGMNIINFYEWPGNVRELKNFAQRIMFVNQESMSENEIKIALGITKNDNIFEPIDAGLFDPENIIELKIFKEKMVNKYVRFVLNNSKNDSDAALKLGMAPSNFYKLCQQLGLKN